MKIVVPTLISQNVGGYNSLGTTAKGAVRCCGVEEGAMIDSLAMGGCGRYGDGGSRFDGGGGVDGGARGCEALGEGSTRPLCVTMAFAVEIALAVDRCSAFGLMMV